MLPLPHNNTLTPAPLTAESKAANAFVLPSLPGPSTPTVPAKLAVEEPLAWQGLQLNLLDSQSIEGLGPLMDTPHLKLGHQWQQWQAKWQQCQQHVNQLAPYFTPAMQAVQPLPLSRHLYEQEATHATLLSQRLAHLQHTLAQPLPWPLRQLLKAYNNLLKQRPLPLWCAQVGQYLQRWGGYAKGVFKKAVAKENTPTAVLTPAKAKASQASSLLWMLQTLARQHHSQALGEQAFWLAQLEGLLPAKPQNNPNA